MGDTVKVSLPIRIKQEGIYCHGFGIVPKFAMCDNSLPLTAKAIYAYFCSLAGNENVSYPGRDTIISRLNITKPTYYKNLKILKEQGYISVHKEESLGGRFPHNTYILESNPKKFSEQQVSAGDSQSIVYIEGIKAAGYGVLPKVVMMDPRLDIKAKGIYAYFASFTGRGKAAFPEVSTILYHLGINETTYRKHLKSLVSTNYLDIRQRREKGKLGVNEYCLVVNPDESAVVPKGRTTKPKQFINQSPKIASRPPSNQDESAESLTTQEVKPSVKIFTTVEGEEGRAELPSVKNLTTEDLSVENLFMESLTSEKLPLEKLPSEELSVGKLDVDNLSTTKTSRTITSNLNTNSSYNQSIYPTEPKEIIDMIDRMNENDLNEHILKKLGVYDELFGSGKPSPQALGIQRLVSLVVTTITVRSSTIHIAKANRARQDVAAALYSLTKDHYIYVLESIKKVANTIKNPIQYQLTALYNAPATYEAKEDTRSNAWVRKIIESRKAIKDEDNNKNR